MESNSIIIRPILTEKSNEIRSKSNQYTFEVNKRANKCEITRAIEDLYKVNVMNCNIVNIKAKPRRQKSRKFGYTREWKKAYITIAKGQAFPFFEGV